jgi:hypothetical protein
MTEDDRFIDELAAEIMLIVFAMLGILVIGLAAVLVMLG